MLRRLATLFCIMFALALFLPLAVPNPKARAAPAAVHHELIRLAPIVVNELLLPKTLNAQVRDTLDTTGGVTSRSIEAAPEAAASTTVTTRRSNSHWIAGTVILAIVVLCVLGYLVTRNNGPDETNYRVKGSGGAT
jgi:beta-lactamase regulating signal transducer with metallopeptidase domain